MKALYCQECGDIIAPRPSPFVPRYCDCTRHAVWWRDPQRGLISAYDTYQGNNKAWLLGITNSLLLFPNEEITQQDFQDIIDSHSETYMFKTRRTCIVRFRPGRSSDSRWETVLPGGELGSK